MWACPWQRVLIYRIRKKKINGKNDQMENPKKKQLKGKTSSQDEHEKRWMEILYSIFFFFFVIWRQQSVKNRSHFWYKTVWAINQIPPPTLRRKQAQEVALAEKSMLRFFFFQLSVFVRILVIILVEISVWRCCISTRDLKGKALTFF